jgi:hypothetical protein
MKTDKITFLYQWFPTCGPWTRRGGGGLQSYCRGSANPYVHHTFLFCSLLGFSKICSVNVGFCDNGCIFLMLHLWPVGFFRAFCNEIPVL